MAVLAYWEKPGTGAVDNKGVRNYVRKWLVEMQHLYDSPPTVWGTGFPAVHRYDPHPGDAGAVAVSLDCSPVGDQLGWYEVTISYTSAPFDKGSQATDPAQTDQSTNPPDRPWTIKLSRSTARGCWGLRIWPVRLSSTPWANRSTHRRRFRAATS